MHGAECIAERLLCLAPAAAQCAGDDQSSTAQGKGQSIIITYRLATHAAHEHLTGFDHGLSGAQKTVETMERSLAAARPARDGQSNDDLLPKVGAMRLLEAQSASDEMIDL